MPPNTRQFLQNATSSRLRWVFLGLIVMTPIISPGMTGPFSGIALPQMKQLSLDEASWFGSIMSISCPFGNLVTGTIIDKYGRRTSILSGIIPNIVGWFLLANKNASLTSLYLGRLLTGFALGTSGLPSVIYTAECITVNDVRIRSSVGTWSTLCMAIGAFLVYGFGALLPYDRVALLSGCLSTLSLFLVLIFIPESPAWLYRKGRIGDAETAQLRLGIKQPILEHSKILPFVANGPFNRDPETDEYSLKNLLHYLSKIRRREVYTPLVITISFLFFCQFSGLYCLSSYMIDVITVEPFEKSAYSLSVVSGFLQIVGGVLLAVALPHSGVKTLSIVSFVGASVCFSVLAFAIVFEHPSVPNIFNYLHVIAVWLTMMLGNMGVMAIPYSILGETFPMGAKGYACLSLFAAALFNFTVLKLFPYMFTQYKSVVFFFFSLVCACGAVFVAVCLPETVGKTMDEIKNGFKQLNTNGDRARLI